MNETLLLLVVFSAVTPTPAATPTPSTPTASTPSTPSTLEQAFRRESALLTGEADALTKERERVTLLRSARIAALREETAALEAQAVEAAARVATLRTQVEELVHSERAPAVIGDDDRKHVVDAFVVLGLPQPAWTGPRSFVDLLPTALAALEKQRRVQTEKSGFFDGEGHHHEGTVATLGGFRFAASADAAGPVLPPGDGGIQLVAVEERSAGLVRALVAGEHPAFVPVLLAPEPEPPAESSALARLEHGGPGGVFVVAVLLLASGVIGVGAFRVARHRRAVVDVSKRLAGLVGSGENVAAAALARIVPGSAGRYVLAVVAAVTRIGKDPDDEVGALIAEAFAEVDRTVAVGRAAAVAALAVAFAVAAAAWAEAANALSMSEPSLRAVLDGVLVGLLPLQLAALWVLPATLLLVFTSLAAARLKEHLEILALRLVDVATGARREG